MCHHSCHDFVRNALTPDDVADKLVLEVGSYDDNGSPRPHAMALGPARYVGVDVQLGRGVDQLCHAERLVARFGRDAFDCVISTEMLEHVVNWRRVIHNLKQVLAPGGVLIVTTRSLGFPYHEAPFDCWRYEVSDMREIFSDCTILALEADPQYAGVFVKVRKPQGFAERSLRSIRLHSMVHGRPADRITEWDIARCMTARHGAGFYANFVAHRMVNRVLPMGVKRVIKTRLLGQSLS